MSASENFVGPFFRLMDAMRSMPALVWEGHDAGAVGWEGKPDPEQWAVVQWMAKNVRPELLAHQTFKSMRAAGLIDVGAAGEIVLLTPEAKKERAEVRKKLRLERAAERAAVREEERARRRSDANQRAALTRRRMSPGEFVKWISEYKRLRGEWPIVERLLGFLTTDADGPKLSLSRMTLHRYRVKAEAAREIAGERKHRHVTLKPGPAFPADLLASPAPDDEDISL